MPAATPRLPESVGRGRSPRQGKPRLRAWSDRLTANAAVPLHSGAGGPAAWPRLARFEPGAGGIDGRVRVHGRATPRGAPGAGRRGGRPRAAGVRLGAAARARPRGWSRGGSGTRPPRRPSWRARTRVVHVAAVYRTAGHPDSYYREVNVTGTERLLEAAARGRGPPLRPHLDGGGSRPRRATPGGRERALRPRRRLPGHQGGGRDASRSSSTASGGCRWPWSDRGPSTARARPGS